MKFPSVSKCLLTNRDLRNMPLKSNPGGLPFWNVKRQFKLWLELKHSSLLLNRAFRKINKSCEHIQVQKILVYFVNESIFQPYTWRLESQP